MRREARSAVAALAFAITLTATTGPAVADLIIPPTPPPPATAAAHPARRDTRDDKALIYLAGGGAVIALAATSLFGLGLLAARGRRTGADDDAPGDEAGPPRDR